MASSLSMANLLASMRMPSGVNPVVVNLPRPPKLEGALAPNNVLSKAVKFAENMVIGPESMVVNNGYVYTGLSNGWVVEVNPKGQVRKILRMSMNNCGQANAPESACGRPLGIREHKGFLIVADAYHGIFKINPVNGRFETLVDGRIRVNGKRIGGFINDLAVTKDGSIFFTTTSSKYTRSQYMNVILEGETSGRVLLYNPRFPGPMKVKELVTKLNFPNGLQLSKNESILYIAEGARARIFRGFIGKNSPKLGTLELFAENLPGFVDNIRLSPRDTLWVSLSRVRHEGQPSVLDQYGNQPKVRGAIMGMPQQAVMQQAPKYGLVVEMNTDGQIIRSLHDPRGTTYVGVSEVEEENGVLYLGSFDRPFIGKLNLADLPPIKKPGGAGTGINQQLAAFLSQIRQRLMSMSNLQIRDIVISLVQNLVQSKLEALRSQAQARALQSELMRLQQLLARTTTPGTPTQPTSTSAATGTTQAATTSTTGSGQTTSSSTGTPQTTAAASSTTTAAATTTATQAATTTASTAQTTTAGSSLTTSGGAATTTAAAVSTTTGAGGNPTTTAGATGSTAYSSTTTAAATTTGGTTGSTSTTTATTDATTSS